MCDRTTAIRYLITNEYGSKQELVEKIHEHYEVFLLTGFIYEPAHITEVSSPRTPATQTTRRPVREWIATTEAYDRARILRIKPDKDLHLPSSPTRTKNKRPPILSRLLKILDE